MRIIGSLPLRHSNEGTNATSNYPARYIGTRKGLCFAYVTFFHLLFLLMILRDQLSQYVLDLSSPGFQNRYVYGWA